MRRSVAIRTTGALFLVSLVTNCVPVLAQVPFNTTPTWTSTDATNHSTGIAWTDINNDGWLDLIVANGNDIARQRLVVYYNTGVGSLPLTPDWQSSDIDYHGHLAIGDVNKDGFADVAVSVYIGAGGFSQKGKVKLYLNNNGTLSRSPSWISVDSMYTFSCAFGDADGDGWLDLAVACGESYYNRSETNRIYFNNEGTLDSVPGWRSSAMGYSYDVGWADFDNDGDLDLVFADERGPNRMYMNYGDSIGTVAAWTSTDQSQYANSLFVADVNSDGFFDLAISDNNQLGGTGHFKIYLNNAGTLETTPFWSSAFAGYGSGITLVDLDNDGDKDLVTGGWWQPLRIYLNSAGTLPTTPNWTSSTNSVVEAIVFGDFDNDRLDTVVEHRLGNGSRKLFYLPHSPVQSLLEIAVGLDTLALTQYSYDLENGWVCFATPPPNKALIMFVMTVSSDLDMAVSNWDNTIGNYVFKNLTPPQFARDESGTPGENLLFQNYPNPFNSMTTFSFQIAVPGHVTLEIFNMVGQEIETLLDEIRLPGSHTVQWNAAGMPSGIYVYQMRTETNFSTKKMVFIK
jgi:hypothetical protein